MCPRTFLPLLLSGLTIGATAATAGATSVDIFLKVVTPMPVNVGDPVRIDLILQSNRATPQMFDALGAVFTWDTDKLLLVDNDQTNDSATGAYFAGFFPDADGINEVVEPLTPTDGDAYFQAFTFGQTFTAPVAPGEFIATSFIFTALEPTSGTDITLIPTMGAFGETRVLLSGIEITGDIGGPVTVIIGPLGACCFADGTCQVLGEEDCDDAGGTYQGDNTDCDPNPCSGACCFANGTCQVLTQTGCTTAGGTFQGFGTDCDPNPCPQPTGACCFADGTCQVLTQTACTAGGGTYQGNGTDCDPNPCPQPTGRCCFADGTCQVLTAADCTTAGGTFGGNGTTCTPNTCPQPTGRCCFADGTCQVLTAGDCTTAGGTFGGNGTTCTPNTCPQPTGRCCFNDGTCQVLTQADCGTAGGVYGGNGTTCTPNTCPQPTGACCFADGTCQVLTQTACTGAGGTYQGNGTDCDPNPCAQPTGACCFADGTCQVLTQTACTGAGGTYQGNFTDCDPNPCPQPTGACCFADGTCQALTQTACTTGGGTYQGDGTDCDPNPCPQPTGACCFTNGTCQVLTQTACTSAGGAYQGNATTCAGVVCIPQGACCRPNGSCTVGTQAACTAANGTYQGDATTCVGVVCPLGIAQDRVSATEKGSVLIYDKVELRYTAAGALIQDTFIDIANDFPADVRVKMYFINGDPRVVVGGVLIEPGWNWINNVITLTANEPTYWSAATGLPKGVSPFGVLDPGVLPGRPDPEVPGERMLRGFIIAFAVNATGCEIRWNHLKGDACIVRYDQNSAWEYNAWSFAAGVVDHGLPLPDCGTLAFNGVEYTAGFDQLLMDFYAIGSAAFSTPGSLVTLNTDLTLHPLSADLRQETTGPVQTKASFDIWNMNEVKFSGTDRCIICWNQALLSSYGLPNHFFLVNLQTDKGRARIDGLASPVVCPAVSGVAAVSSVDPLLGVVAKHLTFNGATFAVAGTNLHGLGTQTDGVIQFNASGGGGPPPENAGSMWLNTISKEVSNNALAKPHAK